MRFELTTSRLKAPCASHCATIPVWSTVRDSNPCLLIGSQKSLTRLDQQCIMALPVGFEPTTFRLTAGYSTIELKENNFHSLYCFILWCLRWDSNPHVHYRPTILSRSCLPVPSLRHMVRVAGFEPTLPASKAGLLPN